MNRERILVSIVEHENRFDDEMERAHAHRPDGPCNAPSIYDHANERAAHSASILAELRDRLAIIDGPGV